VALFANISRIVVSSPATIHAPARPTGVLPRCLYPVCQPPNTWLSSSGEQAKRTSRSEDSDLDSDSDSGSELPPQIRPMTRLNASRTPTVCLPVTVSQGNSCHPSMRALVSPESHAWSHLDSESAFVSTRPAARYPSRLSGSQRLRGGLFPSRWQAAERDGNILRLRRAPWASGLRTQPSGGPAGVGGMMGSAITMPSNRGLESWLRLVLRPCICYASIIYDPPME